MSFIKINVKSGFPETADFLYSGTDFFRLSLHRGSPIPRGKEGEGAALTSGARFIEQRVTWRKPNLILTSVLSLLYGVYIRMTKRV